MKPAPKAVECFEALAAVSVHLRNQAPKASPSKVRLVNLVPPLNDHIAPIGRATGKLVSVDAVVRGTRKVYSIETELQEGQRPTVIFCCDCPEDAPEALVKVPQRGQVPKRCKSHTQAHAKALRHARRRRYYAANPEHYREKLRAARQKNPEHYREKERLKREANPEQRREIERVYRGKNREKLKEKQQERCARKKAKAKDP